MQVEQVMIAFVESSERQHSLPAMPKAQREAAHQMAEAFALTTQSFGQEPNRHIRLLKVLTSHSSHTLMPLHDSKFPPPTEELEVW